MIQEKSGLRQGIINGFRMRLEDGRPLCQKNGSRAYPVGKWGGNRQSGRDYGADPAEAADNGFAAVKAAFAIVLGIVLVFEVPDKFLKITGLFYRGKRQ